MLEDKSPIRGVTGGHLQNRLGHVTYTERPEELLLTEKFPKILYFNVAVSPNFQ